MVAGEHQSMRPDEGATGSFDPAAWIDDALRHVDVPASTTGLAALLAASRDWLPRLADDRQRVVLRQRQAAALRADTPLYELVAALIAPWLAHRFTNRPGGAPVPTTIRANLVTLLTHLYRPASTATDPWTGLVEWVWGHRLKEATARGRVVDLLARADPEGPRQQAVGLLLTYAQELARGVVDTLAIDGATGEQLDLLLGRRAVGDPAALLPPTDEPPLGAALAPRPLGDHLTVMGLGHYQAVREALYKNTFEAIDGQPWPTAQLRRGEVLGRAQLRPPGADAQRLLSPEQRSTWARLMWEQRGELSDLDADILDALSATWLHQARSLQDSARATVDELIAMRGLTPKHRGEGRRVGYQHRQRQDTFKALAHIQNLWIDIGEVDAATDTAGRRRPGRLRVQSRAFVITDRVGTPEETGGFDMDIFLFRPGEVFAAFLLGPGNQTALLSAMALRYDPYRQVWEKRLARFLSWQWRAAGDGSVEHQIYAVGELLEAVGKELDERRPTETRERLERALDTLREHGVIAGWNYLDWHEPAVGQRGWAIRWRLTGVLIAPPAIVIERYRRGDHPAADWSQLLPAAYEEALPPPALPPTPAAIGALVKERRLLWELNQATVADALSVAQGTISKIERGQAGRYLADPAFRRRLVAWLDEHPPRDNRSDP